MYLAGTGGRVTGAGGAVRRELLLHRLGGDLHHARHRGDARDVPGARADQPRRHRGARHHGGVLAAAGWLAWQRPSVVSAALRRVAGAAPRATRRSCPQLRARRLRGGGAPPEPARHPRRLRDHVPHAQFLEAWFTLWLLTGASLPLEAFVLDTFHRVANIVFKVIPFRLGVSQVGSEAVAQVIGVRPAIGVRWR